MRVYPCMPGSEMEMGGESNQMGWKRGENASVGIKFVWLSVYVRMNKALPCLFQWEWRFYEYPLVE